MSGFELIGFALGVLGTLEQTITVAQRVQHFWKSFQSNEKDIRNLIASINELQYDLSQLKSQLTQRQLQIQETNKELLKSQVEQLGSMLNRTNASLSRMEKIVGPNFKSMWKASRWAEKCEDFQQQLNETRKFLFDFNCFLSNNTLISTGIQETHRHIQQMEKNIFDTIRFHSSSVLHSTPKDSFRPFKQKLQISKAVVPDFYSTSEDGTEITVEGRIKRELIDTVEYYSKILAICGPSGVGKTTILHMLSLDRNIREYFCDGIYYIKLGADAKYETVVGQLASIVRKSGGVNKALEVESSPDIDTAMSIVSDWFIEKKYLLLLDDVWNRKDIGTSVLRLSKELISESNDAGMVFTTRDSAIAFSEKLFQVERREPRGTESRAILMRHAHQENTSKLDKKVENILLQLLDSCNGLPVAHSVVGNGVRRYMIRPNVSAESAWRIYFSKQENILQRGADGYGSLWSIFETALSILDEEAIHDNDICVSQAKHRYSYREMHRSLSVLEKQQWAPLHMLRYLWAIEDEDDITEICTNFVRTGLAEWHHEIVGEDQDMEGISIHDLLHDFATIQAERERETNVWHERIIIACANQMQLKFNSDDGCREWWNIQKGCTGKDAAYMMKNICRHLRCSGLVVNEVVMLVTRPQWICAQLIENGILQYERDVSIARQCIEKAFKNSQASTSASMSDMKTRSDAIGVKEIDLICVAARLSVSYIRKNPDEVWFQMYSRLMSVSKYCEGINTFLKYIESKIPRPWIKPQIDLLSGVETSTRSLVDVGTGLNCMLVLPGDMEVACGCGNGEIVIVNMKECVIKKRWTAHQGALSDIILRRSGDTFISGAQENIVKVWEIGNWREIGSYQISSAKGVILKLSQNDKYLIIAAKGGLIQIWDLEDNKCLHTLASGIYQPRGIVLLRDSESSLICGDRIQPITWKTTDENEKKESDVQIIINKFSFAITYKIKGQVSCIEMTENGSIMITGHTNGKIQVWDGIHLDAINDVWLGHNRMIECIALSKDGKMLVSGSRDCSIQITKVDNGELVCGPLRGHPHRISGVGFIGKSDIVSSSHDGTVRLWKIDGSNIKQHQYDITHMNVKCVTLSKDESTLISGHGDGRLRFWNITTNKLIKESELIHNGGISDVKVLIDGKRIVSVGGDFNVHLRYLNTLKMIKSLNGHKGSIESITVTTNEDYVITGSEDCTIRIWDLKKCDGSHYVIYAKEKINKVFMSRDEKKIISTPRHGDVIRVWDMETKECVKEISHPRACRALREETMSLIGENIEMRKNVFCQGGKNEIRYGCSLHSRILATLEQRVRIYVYSSLQKVICLVMWNRELIFLKLEDDANEKS